MKNRNRYSRLIVLVLAVLLCGFVLNGHAQQFNIERKHIPIQIESDSGVTMVYKMSPLSHSVKYHGYYFLKLFVNYHKENPSQWWDGAILVAVSEKYGTSHKVKLPDKFNGSMSYTADLFVRNDTLWLKSSVSYREFETPCGYFFDETQWTWHYVQEVSELAFEDNRYWAAGQQQIRFTEKQITWETNTANGWSQMEPVNKQYDRKGRPIRILNTDGYYYFVHRCQIRKCREDFSLGGRRRRNTMLRDPMCAEIPNFRFPDGYYIDNYPNNDTIVYDVTSGTSSYDYSSYYMDGYEYGDTLFEGAFCVDNRIYLIVSTPKHTFIARLDNNILTPLSDFGHRYYCNESILKISTLNQLNMRPDCCLLEFNAKSSPEGSGIIDIEGSLVKILYFDFPPQHLGSYPSEHFISTPN